MTKAERAEMILSVLHHQTWLSYRGIHKAINGKISIGGISAIIATNTASIADKIESKVIVTGKEEWQQKSVFRLK